MSALAYSTSSRRHARHHLTEALKSGPDAWGSPVERRSAEIVVLVPRQHVPPVAPVRKRSGGMAALTLLGVAAIHVAIALAFSSQPQPKITPAEVPPMTVEFYRPPVEQPPEPEQPKEPPPPKPQPVVKKPKPVERAKPVEVKSEPLPVQPEVTAAPPLPAPAPEPSPPRPVLTQATADAGYLRNPAPSYPRFAQDQGWEGGVILNVLVLPNGKPKEITILKSSGRKLLDDAAVKAVRRWSFVPAKLDDVPVESWAEVPIDFKLTQ